jgi:peptidoglycan L-alanyl-D-glutamate endopeptidase CwlK
MPEYHYSTRSLNKLAKAHPQLRQLFIELLKRSPHDITITSTYRSPREQNLLYQQGRTMPGQKVTWIDGYTRRSYHNYEPARAVDFAPFPINWNDLQRWDDVAAVAKQIAEEMGIKITWGGDWKKPDRPHIQIELT